MTAQRRQTASNFLNKAIPGFVSRVAARRRNVTISSLATEISGIAVGPRPAEFRVWACGAYLGQRVPTPRTSPRPPPGSPVLVNHDFIMKNQGFFNFEALRRRLRALYSAASGSDVCPQLLWAACRAFVAMAGSFATAVVTT